MSSEEEEMLLTAAQVRFFDVFGYLVLPGLFRDEIADLSDAFDEVFASSDQIFESREGVHYGTRRQIHLRFLTQHPTLQRLETHARTRGIARSLLHDDPMYLDTDGNIFHGPTGWHGDEFGTPPGITHLKMFFYLDEATAEEGAIRFLPGSQFAEGGFGHGLRVGLRDHDGSSAFDVDARQLPAAIIETRPGDVVVGNYATLHATFGGRTRRMFSMNYREALGADRDELLAGYYEKFDAYIEEQRAAAAQASSPS